MSKIIKAGSVIIFTADTTATHTGTVWSLAPGGCAWVHDDTRPGADPVLVKLGTPKAPANYQTTAPDWRAMLAAVRVLDATHALPVLSLDEMPGEYGARRVWHASAACGWQHEGADRTSISGSAYTRDAYRRELINGNRTPRTAGGEYTRTRDRAYRLGDALCPACLTVLDPVLTPVRAA